MTSNFDIMLKGIIYKKGESFNSFCLDVDVSARGDSIEEARDNLIRAVEAYTGPGELSIIAQGVSAVTPEFSNNYEAIVEEFYFKQSYGILGNLILDDFNAEEIPGDEADEEKRRIISITGRNE